MRASEILFVPRFDREGPLAPPTRNDVFAT